MKKKILIMAGYYLPSVKAGGPVRSIKNIVDNLSDDFEFYILANDRDLGDERAFDNISADKWIKVGKAHVYYTDISKFNFSNIKKFLNETKYDSLYLNSYFSTKLTTIPLLLKNLRMIPNKTTIIAPRGQFSPGAIKLKWKKKKIFINFTKLFNFHNTIIWHATNIQEKNYIKKYFGDNQIIKIADNLSSNYKNLQYEKNLSKVRGELKVVFISRIHPKKNLEMAIESLKNVHGHVNLDIYGPVEDEEYWESCRKLIDTTSSNINISYKGLLNHSDVINVFKKNHVFLFPTLGENFGHVISEAFIGGCPVIISDQTPWRNLESLGIGWDIPLGNSENFSSIIKKCVDLNQEEYSDISYKAFDYIKNNSNKDSVIKSYYNLFDH